VDYALFLPEIILTVTGLLIILADSFASDKRSVAFTGFVGTAAALVAAVTLFGNSEPIWRNMIYVDDFAVFFKVVFLSVLLALFLFSGEYLEKRRVKVGEFYALSAFATLGAMLVAASYNLITIYLGLELLTISSYVLAGMLKTDPRSGEASLKFFLVGALTSGVVLYGISLLYGLAGSTDLRQVAGVIAGGENSALAVAATVFLIAGFGFKVAAVPFHMWAPDAYDGAPTPVSAFLITASEAAGFAALLRILLVGLGPVTAHWQLAVAILAAVTMTYGNVTAILQTRTKRMLAYSAIAQAGYVLVGVAVATQASVSAMLFYLLAYAFMTVGAFAVVIFLSNHIPGEEIDDFKGLARRAPGFALAMVVLLVSLVGIPPTAGFFGKFVLFRSAVEAGFTWLAQLMVLNSVISVPYYYRVIRNMYLGETERAEPLSARPGLKVVLGVSVAVTLLLGIFPEPLVRFLSAVQLVP